MNYFKLIVATFSLLFLRQTIYAQSFTYKMGSELLLEKKEWARGLLRVDDNFQYYYMSYEKENIITHNIKVNPGILKLDKNCNVVKKVLYSSDKEDQLFFDFDYIGSSFLLLSYEYVKEEKQTLVYGILIDGSTLESKGPSKVICKIPGKDKDDIILKRYFSRDHSKLMIQANSSGTGDKDPKKYYFSVLDENLQVIQEKTGEFNYRSEQLAYNDACVSNSGDIFAMYYYYPVVFTKNVTRNSENKEVTAYEMMSVSFIMNKPIREVHINMGDHVIDRSVIEIDPYTNDVVFSGTYEYVSYDGFTGCFYYRIDPSTGELLVSKSSELPLEFIQKVNKLAGDKTKGDHPGIRTLYEFRNFCFHANGEISLFFEYQYNYTYRTASGLPRRQYHMDHDLVLHLDSNGNFKWYNILPKLQSLGDNERYPGGAAVVLNNKLFVFYNDSKNNLDYDPNSGQKPKSLGTFQRYYLMAVEFDDTGTMHRSIAIDTGDEDKSLFAIPRISKINENQVAITIDGGPKNDERKGVLTLK